MRSAMSSAVVTLSTLGICRCRPHPVRLRLQGRAVPTPGTVSELDLAAQFGVAPMTVREALATLRDQGLVETRRGRSGGSFVRRPASPPIEQLTTRLADLSPSDLRDLFDEHTAIAGQSARLAAERAAPLRRSATVRADRSTGLCLVAWRAHPRRQQISHPGGCRLPVQSVGQA